MRGCVSYNVLRMNEGLAGRVPEEGVGRLISFEKQTKQHTSVGRSSWTWTFSGMAPVILMELDGLVRAVRATAALDVMVSLMECDTFADAKLEAQKRSRGVEGMTRALTTEVDTYALFQRRPHALQLVIANAQAQLLRQGVRADAVLLPPGCRSILAQRPESQGSFSKYAASVPTSVHGCMCTLRITLMWVPIPARRRSQFAVSACTSHGCGGITRSWYERGFWERWECVEPVPCGQDAGSVGPASGQQGALFWQRSFLGEQGK